jgi:DNA helicase-2/ATP-dependent DNA helicase PcrA
MTLHAAKGLEFPVVFLVGAEEDLLPCAGIQGEARDLDEERRLAYVGITRARQLLYLTRATQRVKRGKVLLRTPSRFLAELPPGAHEVIDPNALAATPEELAAHTASGLAQLRARLSGAGGGS